MEATSTVPRIPVVHWVAAVLFILLFTAFFPAMIWLGLRSPAFWTVFILLWISAAIHGRLTAEQLVMVRKGLRGLIGWCVTMGVIALIYYVINFLLDDPVVHRWERLRPLVSLPLALFCAICALVSSYKQNPS